LALQLVGLLVTLTESILAALMVMLKGDSLVAVMVDL